MLTKVITISTILSLTLSANANEDITPYVVGGVDSKTLELPWQVYIEIDKNGSRYACGGTLITDTWVVTAAHCLNENDLRDSFTAVKASQVTVYSGGIDRSNSGNQSSNSLSKLIVHPGYSEVTNTDDIALLQLSAPAASPAQAIKLMDNGLQIDADIEFKAGIGNNLVLSGWGRTSTDGQQSTDILQKSAVTGISDDSCAITWRWAGREANYICANAFNRGSCNGDSGGPLIWQDKNAISDRDLGYRLAGVVSFGHADQCAKNNTPDVYTEVSTYRKWLVDTIELSDSYQAPDPLFTQDIFEVSSEPMEEKSGGGLGYSLLLLLTGLWLYRRS
ncbi:serine protease [Moritella marina ATCC 15381]|uniref:Serine protease n=1 Tax=Moritella marina ATCC 15381 TaxID=1202962 RepID=A0A5J6WK77_MORMI|nr:serine protease [Moritella marina]QFI37621.1 serine protease [Moritella marina ATCC 15381]